MIELCWGVLFLGIAVCINWAMGLYDKIGVEQIRWDWKQFARGAIKMAIIVGAIIGLGYTWEYSGIDLSGAGLEPITMTTTATAYYAYKAIKHLANILHGKSEQSSDTEQSE